MAIRGAEALSDTELMAEIDRGGRIVCFSWCLSILVMSFKNSTDPFLIRAGESAALRSLPYTLLSLLVGWWGFPWGLIYTPWVVIENLGGGRDVTLQFVSAAQAHGVPSGPPPGSHVIVRWTDGQNYSAQVLESAGSYLLVDISGRREWVPHQAIVG